MKGLLCKDWAILVNSYKKNFLIMVVLYLGMAVCLHMDYLCYALVAVCGVYASSTMNFDDSAHWDTYVRTLPVTPGQVVGCKYLLGLLFTLFGSVCAAVGIFLAGQYADVLEAAFSILVIAAFSLLLFAVNMPFSYKFGAVRAGTWVYLVTFFGVFLIIFAMEHLPYLQRSSVISQLDALGNALTAQPVLLLLPSAAVLLLYLGSWALSVQIYQRKEF
jgi:ABC-2 type transport system permease protein